MGTVWSVPVSTPIDLKTCQAKYAMTAFNSKEKHLKLAIEGHLN